MLNEDPAEPKLNRAIQTTLPPGSTFKLVTAAAALESGNYTGESDVPGGPTFKLPQSTKVIGNGGRDCGTDRIPFVQALEQSCNTTFLALADELGNEAMTEQAEAFGFNSTALEDLPAQAESVYPTGRQRAQHRADRHRPVRGPHDAAADGDGGRRDRQRRQGDAALPRRRDPLARPRHPREDRAGDAVGGDELRQCPGPARHARLGRRQRHRHPGGDPRRGGRRQDRHRRVRPGGSQELRVVRVLRARPTTPRSRSR